MLRLEGNKKLPKNYTSTINPSLAYSIKEVTSDDDVSVFEIRP